jgi:hypothetical protein
MGLIKRRGNSPVARVSAVDPESCKISVKALALVEFLSLEVWDDGKPRKTGSITVFFEEGVFKAWLNDKDAGHTCCVAADTLGGLLASIERKLPDDSFEWRKARPAPSGGKR